MTSPLLNYYEAIEQASQDMLEAARSGNWDQVVKLEGACALLISQLKHAAANQPLPSEVADLGVVDQDALHDARLELRLLAEPWLEQLDELLAGRTKTLH